MLTKLQKTVLWIMAGGVALDQASKLLAERLLGQVGSVPVLGDFFRLTLAHNYGFSFSMGTAMPPVLKKSLQVLVPVLVLIFVAVQARKSRLPAIEAITLSFIGAGAIGNLIDRVFLGYVIDFLDFDFYGILGFYRWPTFNAADTFIVVGAIVYAATQLLPHREDAAVAGPEPDGRPETPPVAIEGNPEGGDADAGVDS